MAKSGSERQALLRNRVRKGELKRLQVYLTPNVSDALNDIAGWLDQTKTEVIRDLVLNSHIELAKHHRPQLLITGPITMKDIRMQKFSAELYDVFYRDTRIGYANKRSDGTWVAAASPDTESYEGRTRRLAVSKFIQSFR